MGKCKGHKIQMEIHFCRCLMPFLMCWRTGILGGVVEPSLQLPGHLPPHLPGLYVRPWSWWIWSWRGKITNTEPVIILSQHLNYFILFCLFFYCFVLWTGLCSHPHHTEMVRVELGEPLGGVCQLGLLSFNSVTTSGL